MFFTNILFLMLLLFILWLFSFIMKEKKEKELREKLSPFECGYDPEHKVRNAFSLRFFLITLIFLIFDVEISILFPNPFMYFSLIFNWNLLINFILFFLLFGGLIFEWMQGAMEWQWISI